MTADKRLSADLLTESEATLRLVDTLLEELGGQDGGAAGLGGGVGQVLGLLAESRPADVSDLTSMFLRVYLAVVGALGTLRRTRGALERATVEQVQTTQEKLREVTSTTELAATDMLNGLDHALGLIDRLEDVAAEAGDAEREEAVGIRQELRDELYRLISCLQFQDIAAQQLSHASNVLVDVEKRLESVVELFDVSSLMGAPAPADGRGASTAPADEPRVYDPAASMLNSKDRQALADEIFTVADPDADPSAL